MIRLVLLGLLLVMPAAAQAPMPRLPLGPPQLPIPEVTPRLTAPPRNRQVTAIPLPPLVLPPPPSAPSPVGSPQAVAPAADITAPEPPSAKPVTPAPLSTIPEPAMCAALSIENATIAELQEALKSGKVTSAGLTRDYIARIAAYDRAGPQLNSIRELNPDALAIAAVIDNAKPDPKAKKPKPRPPLLGIPILLKDNIATGDAQHTTAGSLALADAFAKRDATVTAKLRAAGAVILGKANLTEFANILAVGMPSGYSSLGGQVRNAYAPALDERGIPIVHPGGSSAGSAVAVAAGFAAASIGTETSGSLLSPATLNGLVTVKPTVGLISRAGIIPIAGSQDTAGPMTRTVRDAAILLSVLAGPDKLDPATARAPKGLDYTKYLDKDGLKGARIGLPSDPADPGNDVYYGRLGAGTASVMADVVKALEAAGATVVRQNIATEGWIGGAGTDMAILNRNPMSPGLNTAARLPIVFVYELKHDMNLYLKDWAKGTAMRTLGDIIAFNAAHADRALKFGQDIFLAAQGTTGDLHELEYKAARHNDLRSSRSAGMDAYMEENKLDAVLFPGTAGAAITAKAGYPSVQVPAGFISGVPSAAPGPGRATEKTAEYPLGATFAGRAWSEPTLLRIAYAFEQATLARRMPPGVPALRPGCIN